MDALRRTLLKGAGATGAIAAAMAAGVLKPSQVLAAEYNRAAFEAKDVAGALKAIGAGSAAENKDIVIRAPDIAENGAVVPVDIVSNIPNTISLAVMVDKNPFPLTSA
ncbi:MAG: thiosulfate oxidation carrier protein SoxY, partial [Sulfuritalea sp.]|nr:thiosulfate oxidation carrier protein SoxY [Sulfuritalea sp.]